MILADTSVWVDHFRSETTVLAGLLGEGQVMTHSVVVGELACGNLRARSQTLGWFRRLPQAAVASDDEILILIERHKLWGLGIGWIDAHLIASALLSDVAIWTLDRRLALAASAAHAKLFSPAGAD